MMLCEKSYDKPRQCIEKKKYHFADKGLYNQSYDFSSSHVWMWELDYKESWASKNWCFWTVMLEKTDSWESLGLQGDPTRPFLKEISPEYSLERLMLKLKLQYFGHLMQRAVSLEKALMLERLRVVGEGDDRGWDGWMASVIQWAWVWVGSGSWWWTGKPGML